MKPKARFLLVLVLFIAALVAVDLVSKILAEKFLAGKGVVYLVDNILVLTYAENRGAFLSLGAELGGILWTVMMIILPVGLVVGLLVYLAVKETSFNLKSVSYALIVAGGLGNIVDRVTRGGQVRDFINAGIGNIRTGVLNIADLYVTAAVVILLILSFRKKKPETPAV